MIQLQRQVEHGRSWDLCLAQEDNENTLHGCVLSLGTRTGPFLSKEWKVLPVQNFGVRLEEQHLGREQCRGVPSLRKGRGAEHSCYHDNRQHRICVSN